MTFAAPQHIHRTRRTCKNASKPDGTPRKLMHGDKLAAMGRRPRLGGRKDIEGVYRIYQDLARHAA